MKSNRLIVSATLIVTLCFVAETVVAEIPDQILLWPNGAPGAKGEEERDKPSIRIYEAPREKSTGSAVVVCPGGGYGGLAMDHEGVQVARWFTNHGITAAVLKYRLGSRYNHPAPMHDVQRAVRYLRSHAKQLKVATDRIGVIGFSAGGHLASTAATHFDPGQPESQDEIDRVSCRPDFAVLCYPVITMTGSWGHRGSKRNLLGTDPDQALAELMSNEKQVSKETPPTFLFHTAEDRAVPVRNSLEFFLAMQLHGVPGEMHVYQNGQHGVGLATGDPVTSTWTNRLADWLQNIGMLNRRERAAVRGTVKVKGESLRWGAIALSPGDDNGTRPPVAWSLVIRGKFSIPAHRGAFVGMNNIAVYDLGTVAPMPTLDQPKRIDRSESTPLQREIKGTDNTIDLSICQ